jgi:hypothetical protein
MGQDVEVLVAGRVLLRARVREPKEGGAISMAFRADEIVEVANRLATDGRLDRTAATMTD